MFVNEDSMDFHLQMFSPLIDAGDPNILDLDGSRSDIGLFGGPYGENTLTEILHQNHLLILLQSMILD